VALTAKFETLDKRGRISPHGASRGDQGHGNQDVGPDSPVGQGPNYILANFELLGGVLLGGVIVVDPCQ